MILDIQSRFMGLIAEKNTDLQVTSFNDIFIKFVGKKSLDEVIGKNDYDFCWNKFANLYEKHERDALQGEQYSLILPSKSCDGETRLYLQTKLPKVDEYQAIVGIFCRAIEVIDIRWKQYMFLLSQFSNNTTPCYTINEKINNCFSKRQSEVLFYLAKGKSNKIIASFMGLSTRSIEHYIETIKVKCSCKTKAELICFAMQNGFDQVLPEDSIDSLIKKIKG